MPTYLFDGNYPNREGKMETSAKNTVFRIADLTSKKIAAPKQGSGIGSVGYLGPDQDPDDFSPISPWVMVGKIIKQLDFLDKIDIDKVNTEMLDEIALDVGRNVVAGKFFPGTALCSENMPTCARNERISPVASLAESITNIDLGVVRHQLELAIERIDRFDKKFG
jgi:hypothetical protein